MLQVVTMLLVTYQSSSRVLELSPALFIDQGSARRDSEVLPVCHLQRHGHWQSAKSGR
jgi:hypothetical protein